MALVLMYIGHAWFGTSVGGLFSPQYIEAPWSYLRVLDLVKHLWIPVIVVGTAGTAGLIRIMRGNLLDELRKQYVITARSKGLTERALLFRYPVRIAINPLVSTVGWLIPNLISGATITAVVLSLPTTGPLLLRSLMFQDMYVAGTLVMLLAILTVIGTLISDVLLAFIDPRIRFGGRER
jgi:peptide/nickel transport system permease protein